MEKLSENTNEAASCSTSSSDTYGSSFDEEYSDIPHATTNTSSLDTDSNSFEDRYREVTDTCDPIISEL